MTIDNKPFLTFEVEPDKESFDGGSYILKPTNFNLFATLEEAENHTNGNGLILDLSVISKDECDFICE